MIECNSNRKNSVFKHDFHVAVIAEIDCSRIARVEHVVLVKVGGNAEGSRVIDYDPRHYGCVARISFYRIETPAFEVDLKLARDILSLKCNSGSSELSNRKGHQNCQDDNYYQNFHKRISVLRTEIFNIHLNVTCGMFGCKLENRM